MVGSEQKNKKN